MPIVKKIARKLEGGGRGSLSTGSASSKSISKMSASELRARAALLKNQEALNKGKIASKNKAIVNKIKKK